jgi:hypothetical protein
MPTTNYKNTCQIPKGSDNTAAQETEDNLPNPPKEQLVLCGIYDLGH